MSKREWKPGDVALVTWGGGTEVGLRAEQGWSFADMHQWLGNAHPHTARPLVVIDPEDREQVERLWRIWTTLAPDHRLAQDCMQAALREFANPKPSKPEEPTGLGAVVEDADGRWWMRYSIHDGCSWMRQTDGPVFQDYDRIDAVRVLSEGVQP